MNTLSQHNLLIPRVKSRSLSPSKGRLLSLRFLRPSKESKGRLLLLFSLMLLAGAAMAQEQQEPLHVPYPVPTQRVIVEGNVFGGGNKADVAGKSSVTLNRAGDSIHGDVYGGGALANVGTTSADSTIVNILNGIVNGNVYGGGLGDSIENCYGGTQNIRAYVHGKVYVNIGTERDESNPNDYSFVKINGSVFGCNNINGTPLDSVFVNVYRTWHSSINYYPSDTITSTSFDNMERLRKAAITANADENYAIKNVYGGGNKASYKPERNTDVTPITNKCTTVHVYYCDENTIKTVYGGGNAADAGTAAKPANTHLIIDGGRFDKIFGGGNGYSEFGNHDPEHCEAPDYNPGANIKGSATTDFYGGLCNQLFGGSNQFGDIAEANLNIKDGGCLEMILESFCGGNEADMTGADINATIANCDIRIGTLYGGSNNADIKKNGNNGGNVTLNVLGGHYDNVFGGSKGSLVTEDDPTEAELNAASADIEGNVTLNLHGGTISSAYGGSDVNGNIKGIITVNVLDTVYYCPLQVDTVYGAGRDAAYTPDEITTGVKPVSPNVNIQHATIGHGTGSEAVPGCVFGGGKGSTATVTAHPKVIIGELATINNPHDNLPINTADTVTGEVYGGGNAAAVLGGTTVIMQKCNSYAKYVYGGGNAADVNSTKVYVNGGTIDTIFGGGHGDNDTDHLVEANVNGNDTIAITEGKVGKVFAGSNLNGNITGRMSLNVAKSDTATCDLRVGEVYGGGNMAAGKAGTITIGCTGTWTTGEGNTHEHHNNTNNRIGYELEGIGTVYGGANMADIGTSEVPSNIVLNIKKGMIDNVFGGNNTSGDIYGTIQVNIDSIGGCGENNWYVGNVYGGGNLAAYGSNSSYPQVNILEGTVSYNVFGGGLGSSATVTGNPVVNLNGGTVNGSTFGGGSAAPVIGNPVVNALKGIANDVFGGGLGETAIVTGNPSVIVNQASGETMTINDVFGGGDAAAVTGNTSVQLQAGAVANAFGGGNQAGVSNQASVSMSGGSVSTGLYGGCNTSGTVAGNITVNVTGGTIGAAGDGNSANVHGGGYGQDTKTGANVEVTINQASGENPPDAPVIWGDVYGGSALGSVNDSASSPSVNSSCHTWVTLNKGTVHGDIYGGGLGQAGIEAKVWSPVQVTVNGGTVDGSIYGCNNVNGAPQSDVNVDIYGTDIPESGYALANVFGGGNQAAYSNTPVVKVHNCNNSIEYVYGGGNAANVKGTDVTIYGGNSIAHVFGGCYGANVTELGTDVKIYGGTIDTIYGGNNQSGTITGVISVTVDKQGDDDPNGSSTACDMHIKEVYGGGNKAASNAGTITINCTGEGDTEGIEYVYGGANCANVTGPINLTIDDGRIGNVFGGNNHDGTITGGITVNIEKAASPCVWDVGNVFGGGNLAATTLTPTVNIINGTVSGSVFGGGNEAGVGGGNVAMSGGTVLGGLYGGCNTSGNVSGNITVNVSGGTIGSLVNLSSSDHITADVFGGGYGQNTSTSGNVEVNINDGIIYGDVYGGSALGNVNQNSSNTTVVNVMGGTLETITTTHQTSTGQDYYIYHGGNVYGGGLGRKDDPDTQDNEAVAAQVNGKVYVNIGTGTFGPGSPYTTTTSGEATIKGNVYGGNNTNGSPQDSVFVNIYHTAHTATDSATYIGTTPDVLTYALANVFGGGNAADYIVAGKSPTVNIYGCDNTIERTFGGGNAAATNTVTTMVQGGRIRDAFGGGNGEVTAANINGDVNLNIHGGNIGQTFAGSNQNGVISGVSTVTIDGEGCGDVIVDEFFCGGNFADFHGNINATIDCAEGMHVRNLYGGCKQANVVPSGTELGDIHLVVNGGTYENIYGGSQGTRQTPANISGRILLEVFGGTVTHAIYGGCHINGSVGDTIVVNVENKHVEGCELDVSFADVYGGGNEANYSAPNGKKNFPEVNIKNATVKNVFGGGYQAEVNGNPQVHIKKGAKVLGNVYGGGNMGQVVGSPKVIINGKLE